MTEIFITNVQNEVQTKNILDFFKIVNPELKITLDLNETENSYPCGHTIIRVEGDKINAKSIVNMAKRLGYNCDILEDKICK